MTANNALKKIDATIQKKFKKELEASVKGNIENTRTYQGDKQSPWITTHLPYPPKADLYTDLPHYYLTILPTLEDEHSHTQITLPSNSDTAVLITGCRHNLYYFKRKLWFFPECIQTSSQGSQGRLGNYWSQWEPHTLCGLGINLCNEFILLNFNRGHIVWTPNNLCIQTLSHFTSAWANCKYKYKCEYQST